MIVTFQSINNIVLFRNTFLKLHFLHLQINNIIIIIFNIIVIIINITLLLFL